MAGEKSNWKKFLEMRDNLNLSNEDLDGVREYMLMELKLFLGVLPTESDDIDEAEMLFAEHIQDVYDDASKDCYFCSDEVDPNEEEYGEKRKACLMCTLKLESFIKHLGSKMKARHGNVVVMGGGGSC